MVIENVTLYNDVLDRFAFFLSYLRKACALT